MTVKLKLPRFRVLKPRITTKHVKEACLAAGLLFLARGLWLIYPPAMWLVCGVVLIWLAMPERGERGSN